MAPVVLRVAGRRVAADLDLATSTPRAALAAALAGDPAWAGAGGGADALASLLKEQEGDLCGPRPERGGLAQAAAEAEAAALGVGRAIDGRELLQLLRSVRL